MFKTLGLHRVGFTHSLVTRLYNGNFTYPDASTSGNFSPFCFYKTGLLCIQQKGQYLILHLAEIQGQKRRLKECKVSAKHL
eukprot:5768484-Ditylum_brightwellii.AAC.1